MTDFDDERIKRIVALAEARDQTARKAWTTETVYERIDGVIIGNTRYKRALSVCLSELMAEPCVRKHLLVAGPSGTGKTYLLEQCLPLFNLPSKIIDASSLVPSGIKGSTLNGCLEPFFQGLPAASSRCVLVLDEFDKLSDKTSGIAEYKSSIQSELLTLVHGKQEGCIDTRGALWIFAGAFAYADQMKCRPATLTKTDLLAYGFKNELLGRIARFVMTDIPTVEEVVRRVVHDKKVKSLLNDLKARGYDIEFEDSAYLELAMATQNPAFGMRVLDTVTSNIKETVVFDLPRGKVLISPEMVKQSLH